MDKALSSIIELIPLASATGLNYGLTLHGDGYWF